MFYYFISPHCLPVPSHRSIYTPHGYSNIPHERNWQTLGYSIRAHRLSASVRQLSANARRSCAKPNAFPEQRHGLSPHGHGSSAYTHGFSEHAPSVAR